MNTKALLALLPFIFSLAQPAAGDEAKDVAVVLKALGKVQITRAQQQPAETAKRGTRLHSGNLLRTGDDSQAALVFTDDRSVLKIRANSKVAINGRREEQGLLKTISLEFGQLWAKVTKSSSPLSIETPSGVAAVKGTMFYCVLDEDGNMMIFCLEGLVELYNELGRALVKAGHTGIAQRNEAPRSRPSTPGEVPNWGNENGGGYMEIELKDDKGQKKRLKLLY